MSVTLKQIAKRSGLSLVTVSYVLNEKGHLFRPETRARVLEAAEQLGYRPNSSAKAMQSGRFNSIALVMSNERYRSAVTADFVSGCQEVIIRHDLHLTVTELPDSNLTDDLFIPKILRESMSDGLIINYFQDIPELMLELIDRHHLPAVWTNVRRPHDSVRPDDLQGGRLATEHLLRLGHRKIAYVDGVHNFDSHSERQDHYSAAERLEGYSLAMLDAGLTPRLLSQRKNMPASGVAEFASQWLAVSDRPTAVVTYCPREAQGVLLAATRLGLQIPKDLSIVTFNGQPLDIGQPISTVLIPERQMGTQAVRMLLEKIAAPKNSLPAQSLPMVMGPDGSTVSPTN